MRPYVYVNVAMSADGKISTTARKQVRISGKEDFQRVDRLRAESDGIMVGIGTVLSDNPSLTIKSDELKKRRLHEGKDENPVRIVVDSHARTPPDADILHRGAGRRIIAVSRSARSEKIATLERKAEILVAGDNEVDLAALMDQIGERGVERLMVEGGGTLIYSLFAQGLVNEFCTYVGNLVIGGGSAPTPADGAGFMLEKHFVRLELKQVVPMDSGVLIRWKVKGGGFTS
ncbi:MAG: 2,5-diamino-6-(ribosylamino)-4(3H)-pyrimidinone 5'-phosphate reductase [Methanomicrobiales archaeon]|nr:2,5-diamino-6-(ribosylamino)-4(3H)-pyrimidinone 5'-phosphate reductase [Methanomicrobiales archaeon]